MRILLLGGSKSGKSGLAQTLTRNLAAGGPMIYWATMEPVDDEDRARIQKHLEDRAGWGFETVERGRDLTGALPLAPGASVLLDSVTALLANEMFGANLDEGAPNRAAGALLEVSRQAAHLVCVCDDLFRDAGRYDSWTECYRRGLAQICRRLAREFDLVCEVTAGIVKAHKGAELLGQLLSP
ncbi:MAG: bifunctional adenosylcobinamide kinase/adenosylcobinamide-phosphate guanylyltransferase [Candidatus Faecousia sp.]|nr:bifunctional adenosylcobinamide kinase/adenosylcobinamide-phosphate guanylyltransferase [Bacillota bacterium]MDY4219447.1 bifunctional adenosylcobinamide kinase/adenosylcobinamide-phosphate guanylyltransferase [Candidatus Faecousia sp.]